MTYEELQMLAALVCGLCIAQTVWIMVLHSQRDEARESAYIVAKTIDDIARGKAKAYIHMGSVHITDEI